MSKVFDVDRVPPYTVIYDSPFVTWKTMVLKVGEKTEKDISHSDHTLIKIEMGAVLVRLEEALNSTTNNIVSRGRAITIPSGSSYSIQNIAPEEARLWIMYMKSCDEIDDWDEKTKTRAVHREIKYLPSELHAEIMKAGGVSEFIKLCSTNKTHLKMCLNPKTWSGYFVSKNITDTYPIFIFSLSKLIDHPDLLFLIGGEFVNEYGKMLSELYSLSRLPNYSLVGVRKLAKLKLLPGDLHKNAELKKLADFKNKFGFTDKYLLEVISVAEIIENKSNSVFSSLRLEYDLDKYTSVKNYKESNVYKIYLAEKTFLLGISRLSTSFIEFFVRGCYIKGLYESGRTRGSEKRNYEIDSQVAYLIREEVIRKSFNPYEELGDNYFDHWIEEMYDLYMSNNPVRKFEEIPKVLDIFNEYFPNVDFYRS